MKTIPDHHFMTAYGSTLEDFTWYRRRAIRGLYEAAAKARGSKISTYIDEEGRSWVCLSDEQWKKSSWSQGSSKCR